MKNYIIISILLLFFGCKKTVYKLTEDEKKAFLFYTYDIGDSFSLIKNNVDTINFTVRIKNIETREQRNLFNPLVFYETYVFKATKRISIEISYEEADLVFPTPSIDMFIDGCLELGYVKDSYSKIMIDNAEYHNVYLLTHKTDSCYTSVQYGIIKAWNDSVVYRRVQ